MARLSKEEYFNSINKMLGENTSEEALQFIENMTDTYNELDNNASKGEYTQEDIDNINRSWSKKYRERFFSGGEINLPPDKNIEEEQRSENIALDDILYGNNERN